MSELVIRRARHPFKPWKACVYLILSLCALVMMLPFVWLVLTSFKTLAESVAIPVKWFPDTLLWENYREVLFRLNMPVYYRNTLIVTCCSVLGQLLICSLSAYAFGRMRFPGKNALFLLILTSLLIPQQMTLIPKYLLCVRMGLVNTLAGIVIPNLFNAYGVFFLRQFFMTLPHSLEESARLDGCSYFRVYWNIMLPLCTSGLVAFGILTLIGSWNELLWPLIITSTDTQRVLSVGIAALQGEHESDFPIMMAASVMATLPMILVFVFGQKKFIAGIATSGMKL